MHGFSGGACMVAQGGVHGCSGGCLVAPVGHVWLLQGACVVALGGMHGCSGGMHGCSGGVCMVARGHAWLLPGGCVRLLPGGGHAWDMTRYGGTVNERAVRILLECILVTEVFFCFVCSKTSDVNIANFVQFVKNLIT